MVDEAERRARARAIVAAGYDHMAERYLAGKGPLDATVERLLTALRRGQPAEAPTLDLGCGAGVPVTRWLAARGPTIGVDLSARQLALARRLAPGAALVRADMTEAAFRSGSLGAVVACHSIIHVPREAQPALLGRIRDWLRPGGGLLATWAPGAWEGEEADWEGWGAPMWWSHYDAATSLALLRAAGFAIEAAEEIGRDGAVWLWALARRTD